jgi:hypothetical protein
MSRLVAIPHILKPVTNHITIESTQYHNWAKESLSWLVYVKHWWLVFENVPVNQLFEQHGIQYKISLYSSLQSDDEQATIKCQTIDILA